MKYLKTLTIFTLFLLFPFFTSQATGLNYCTYEFEYELPTSLTCEDNVIDVTLKGTGNDVCTTYTNVRISFTRVTGPGDVIFKATDVTDPANSVPYTFTNSGFWGPSTGFPVTWNYEATTPFTLDFILLQLELEKINNYICNI
jgi:hypothetical protein